MTGVSSWKPASSPANGSFSIRRPTVTACGPFLGAEPHGPQPSVARPVDWYRMEEAPPVAELCNMTIRPTVAGIILESQGDHSQPIAGRCTANKSQS